MKKFFSWALLFFMLIPSVFAEVLDYKIDSFFIPNSTDVRIEIEIMGKSYHDLSFLDKDEIRVKAVSSDLRIDLVEAVYRGGTSSYIYITGPKGKISSYLQWFNKRYYSELKKFLLESKHQGKNTSN